MIADVFSLAQCIAMKAAEPPKQCSCHAYSSGECCCGAWHEPSDSEAALARAVLSQAATIADLKMQINEARQPVPEDAWGTIASLRENVGTMNTGLLNAQFRIRELEAALGEALGHWEGWADSAEASEPRIAELRKLVWP